MTAVSGRLIIRPTSNGPVQDWDGFEDFSRIDDSIVRPTNALTEGDGQAVTDDDEAGEVSQWGFTVAAVPGAIVSGDVFLWTYQIGDNGPGLSGLINFGDGDEKVSADTKTDGGWTGYRFSDYDGSGLTSTLDNTMGLWSYPNSDGENYSLYASYIELNYLASLDYCECHCPEEGFAYASGACCHWGTLFDRALEESRCCGVIHEFDSRLDDHEQIGKSVSISSSGDFIAWSDDTYGDPTQTASPGSGLVRVYNRSSLGDNTNFTQVGSDITSYPGDPFTSGLGHSISLSSGADYLAVGIPYASGSSGIWRVYNFDGSDWQQFGSDVSGNYDFEPVVPTEHRHFWGSGVAISADGSGVISFGSSGSPLEAVHNVYYTRVHEWDGSDWVQKGSTIHQPAQDNGDVVPSIAINSSGSIIAIGYPGHDTANGEVRAYQYAGGDWVQRGSELNGGSFDRLGRAIDISYGGDEIVVSSPEDVVGNDGAGRVQVFKWDGANYTQVGSNITNTVDVTSDYGIHVSISEDGSGVLIAAPKEETAGDGVVYHYNWNGSIWEEEEGCRASGDGTENLGLGDIALAKSNDTFIVGSTTAGRQSNGLVQVYNKDLGRPVYPLYKESKEPFGIDVGSENVKFVGRDAFNHVGINSSGDRIVLTKHITHIIEQAPATTTTTPTPVGNDIIQAHRQIFRGDSAAQACGNTGSGHLDAFFFEPTNHYGIKVGTELWSDSNLTHLYPDGFYAIHDSTDPVDEWWIEVSSGVIINNGSCPGLWKNSSYVAVHENGGPSWNVIGTPINSGGFLTSSIGEIDNELEVICVDMPTSSDGNVFAVTWLHNAQQANSCLDCDVLEETEDTYHVGVYYWSDTVNNWVQRGDYISAVMSPYIAKGAFGGTKEIPGTFGEQIKITTDGKRLFVKNAPATVVDQMSIKIYDWSDIDERWVDYDTVEVGYRNFDEGFLDGVFDIPESEPTFTTIPPISCSTTTSTLTPTTTTTLSPGGTTNTTPTTTTPPPATNLDITGLATDVLIDQRFEDDGFGLSRNNVEFVVEYEVTAHSVDDPKTTGQIKNNRAFKTRRSRGRMAKKTKKKRRLSPNNVRKMLRK